jgi:PadR family transcriptional regulator PadR
MSNPNGQHWGYELSKTSGVRSGVMYPLLARMLLEGWLSDGWEAESETGGKRPPRRYYCLTKLGQRELGAVLRAAQSDSRFRNRNLDLGLGFAQ